MTKQVAMISPLKYNSMLGIVMDSCGSVILSFLTVRDTAHVAEYSRDFYLWSQEEIGRRSKAWLASTSKSWAWYDKNLLSGKESYISADSLPDNKEALDGLDMVWREVFESPSHLLSTVAAWCGGWSQFLDAREGSARPQPVIARGRPVHFTTISEESPPLISDDRRIVLIFDIHCDGKSAWNAVYPLNESELGDLISSDINGEEVEVSIVHPISSKTLGDATDAATIHPFEHTYKSTRYLLSTDTDDARTWRFNVSMVQRNCLETLIHSCSIVPANQKKYIDEYGAWEPNSGYHQVEQSRENMIAISEYGQKDYIEIQQRKFDSIAPDSNLFRCSDFDVENVTRVPCAVLKGIGIDGDLIEFSRSINFDFCYWLDERNTTKNRLHLTLDFSCPDSLFSDMIMHPQTKDVAHPCSSSSSGENAAKRLRSR